MRDTVSKEIESPANVHVSKGGSHKFARHIAVGIDVSLRQWR